MSSDNNLKNIVATDARNVLPAAKIAEDDSRGPWQLLNDSCVENYT